jgi:hypothetical protein
MRGLFHAIAVGCLCAAIAGCNTPEALTPKEDVPGASDVQAEPRDTTTSRREPVETTTTRVDPAIDQPGSTERAPQNTLEAQQQALERGEENPALTKPDNASLSANLYRNDSAAKPASNIYSAATSENTIRFLPIIGAPVQAVTPLSKELGNTARANGLVIKASSDATARHVLKGYLSAFGDGGKVTIIYVWDVLDNEGKRLHRIQGQESVPGKGADAWASVPPEVMRQIGADSIAEYMKWRAAQG